MYQKIPDHDVAQYVFMIGKGKSVSSESLDFSSQFPKNYILPKLQEFFEKFTEFKYALAKKDKVIQGLENSIKDIMGTGTALAKKDTVIQGYEESIKEQKEYIGTALAKKDTVIQGYEESIKEQKEYTGTALAKKDTVIQGLENSIKEQKEYTGTALAKKDTVIQGLENSIKEQKKYIENIEEHVHQLESKMGKLKFWKK
jgi:chromosome segregation ATPase